MLKIKILYLCTFSIFSQYQRLWLRKGSCRWTRIFHSLVRIKGRSTTRGRSMLCAGRRCRWHACRRSKFIIIIKNKGGLYIQSALAVSFWIAGIPLKWIPIFFPALLRSQFSPSNQQWQYVLAPCCHGDEL
mgnify:CR=1 FL=1